MGARFGKQMLNRVRRLRADQAAPTGDKRRHTGDTVLMRFRPIGIDHVFEGAVRQHTLGFFYIQATFFDDFQNHVRITDVEAINKIRVEKRIVDIARWLLRVRPCADLLGQTAIICVGAVRLRQTVLRH